MQAHLPKRPPVIADGRRLGVSVACLEAAEFDQDGLSQLSDFAHVFALAANRRDAV